MLFNGLTQFKKSDQVRQYERRRGLMAKRGPEIGDLCIAFHDLSPEPHKSGRPCYKLIMDYSIESAWLTEEDLNNGPMWIVVPVSHPLKDYHCGGMVAYCAGSMSVEDGDVFRVYARSGMSCQIIPHLTDE